MDYDYLFKVIAVGNGAVGKTSITLRFSTGKFRDSYIMTIGVDFAIKTIEVQSREGVKKVKLQIWDTGGQERFSYVRPLYYKGAMGGLVVFDVTQPESFESVPKWFEEVRKNRGDVPLILVGNKVDLDDRKVSSEQAQQLAKKIGVKYLETSAKTGESIEKVFSELSSLMVKYTKQIEREG
ncbi:MAG: GTP-binding protein [Promethearchaeati archaeon SRVP18_Atabeyarchaeia-1]